MLGIFSIWSRILAWISFSGPTSSVFEPPVLPKKLKFTQIPVLVDYTKDPEDSYWKDIPFEDTVLYTQRPGDKFKK